jgi:hypothetical protein
MFFCLLIVFSAHFSFLFVDSAAVADFKDTLGFPARAERSLARPDAMRGGIKSPVETMR